MKINLKTALTMIVMVMGAFIYLTVHFASSEEVKTLTKDVRYIELIQLNQVIAIYQNKYSCYKPMDCLPKMNSEDTLVYMRLQGDKTKLLNKIKGKK